MSGAGWLSWCGAVAGWVAPLTIATFVVGGAHKLGLHYRWYAPFVEDAFAIGMLARTRSLGDTGPSDPRHGDEGWRHPENLHVA